MSVNAIIPLIWVLAILFLLGLIAYATVVVRRSDDTVKNVRAITAMYEEKEEKTIPFHDWESYYDVRRDPDLRRPRRGDGTPHA
jgi:hypothetical protein